MQPTPVGETGGSKGQGQPEPEGNHPACTSAARKVGETGQDGAVRRLTLARREGRAPEQSHEMKAWP
jgi:hypothetical protein